MIWITAPHHVQAPLGEPLTIRYASGGADRVTLDWRDPWQAEEILEPVGRFDVAVEGEPQFAKLTLIGAAGERLVHTIVIEPGIGSGVIVDGLPAFADAPIQSATVLRLPCRRAAQAASARFPEAAE